MKISVQNNTAKIIEVLEGLGRVGGGDRTPGLHLSTVYRDLADASGMSKDYGSTQEDQRRGKAFRLGGFLWEEVYEKALAQLYGKLYPTLVQHQEVELDGIIGSPDLLDFHTETVLDTKFTWKSAYKLQDMEKNFWLHLVQNKGYGAMLGGWRKGKLVYYFCNGDYRESGPQYLEVDLEYTKLEIQENWQMLRAHAVRREWLKKGRDGKWQATSQTENGGK